MQPEWIVQDCEQGQQMLVSGAVVSERRRVIVGGEWWSVELCVGVVVW